MALFSRTTKKEAKPKSVKKAGGKRGTPNRDFAWVILRPRITEKATLLSEKNIFAFEVSPRATSRDVMHAVEVLYKVTPMKVNMVKTPASMKASRRGGQSRVPGLTKAYVFLNKGDSITLA